MLRKTAVAFGTLLACAAPDGVPLPPDAGSPGQSSGCLSSVPGRLVDDELRWPWRIHWSPSAATLAASCAAYGDDAVMTMVVDAFDSPRGRPPMTFEEPCTRGEVVVDLPTQLVFHGQYTISSASSGKRSSTLNMNQDVHCNHDVTMMVWPPR
jgi:hypothetical protein